LELGQQILIYDYLPVGAKQHDHHTMEFGSLDKIQQQHHYVLHLPPDNKYNKLRDWLVHHIHFLSSIINNELGQRVNRQIIHTGDIGMFLFAG
jgi:hypothetical protein